MATPSPRASSPRREIKARHAPWAAALARRLAHIGIRPNAVSISSVLFALLAGLAFATAPAYGGPARAALYVAAAALIQMRLLCNLLDGMLAIEGGFGSSTGDLYNDMPDRVADVLILVAAGYAAGTPWAVTLGWVAAVLAVFTAYVRVLGGSLGTTQHFSGPMAKQHRMFVMTVAALLAAGETLLHLPSWSVLGALVVVVVGAVVTAVRRTHHIAAELRAR